MKALCGYYLTRNAIVANNVFLISWALVTVREEETEQSAVSHFRKFHKFSLQISHFFTDKKLFIFTCLLNKPGSEFQGAFDKKDPETVTAPPMHKSYVHRNVIGDTAVYPSEAPEFLAAT